MSGSMNSGRWLLILIVICVLCFLLGYRLLS